jgi:hypothetical protein
MKSLRLRRLLQPGRRPARSLGAAVVAQRAPPAGRSPAASGWLVSADAEDAGGSGSSRHAVERAALLHPSQRQAASAELSRGQAGPSSRRTSADWHFVEHMSSKARHFPRQGVISSCRRSGSASGPTRMPRRLRRPPIQLGSTDVLACSIARYNSELGPSAVRESAIEHERGMCSPVAHAARRGSTGTRSAASSKDRARRIA